MSLAQAGTRQGKVTGRVRAGTVAKEQRTAGSRQQCMRRAEAVEAASQHQSRAGTRVAQVVESGPGRQDHETSKTAEGAETERGASSYGPGRQGARHGEMLPAQFSFRQQGVQGIKGTEARPRAGGFLRLRSCASLRLRLHARCSPSCGLRRLLLSLSSPPRRPRRRDASMHDFAA